MFMSRFLPQLQLWLDDFLESSSFLISRRLDTRHISNFLAHRDIAIYAREETRASGK